MKKLLAICLCLAVMFGVTPAFADYVYEYGDDIYAVHMNGVLRTNQSGGSADYRNFYRGYMQSELTEDNAYEGKTSLKCNIDELNRYAETAQNDNPFNFASSKISVDSEIALNDILVEIYSDGMEEYRKDFTLVVYLEMKDGSQKNLKNFISEPAGKGTWVRNYCLIPQSELCEANRFSVGILYYRDDEATGYFYLDEIKIKLIPVFISADDVTSRSKRINSDELVFYGINQKGVKKPIVFSKGIKIDTVSDMAFVNGNVLEFNSFSGSDADVNAEFLGVKSCLFNIRYEPYYTLIDASVSENEVSAEVQNTSSQGKNVIVYFAVYYGGRLYMIKNTSEFVESGAKKNVKCSLHIPASLKNVSVKALCYNR